MAVVMPDRNPLRALAGMLARVDSDPMEGRVEIPITAVTVYRAGAIIRRQGTLPRAFAVGEALEVGPLPLHVEPGSLRISLESASGETLDLSDVQLQLDFQASSSDMPANVQELLELKRQRERTQTRLARIDQNLGELAALRPTMSEGSHPPRLAPIQAWAEFERWSLAHRRTLNSERQTLERELKKINERISAIQSALSLPRHRVAPSPSHHVALCRVRGAGSDASATLTVDYIVRGAIWTPAYRLRISSDGARADLEVRAHVLQGTGEPWSGVKLQLSTAELLRELALPELTSLRIGRRLEEPQKRHGWRPPPEDLRTLFHGYDDASRLKPASYDASPQRLHALSREANALVSLPESERATRPKPAPPPPVMAPPPAITPPFAPPPLMAAAPGGMPPPPAPMSAESRRMASEALAEAELARARAEEESARAHGQVRLAMHSRPIAEAARAPSKKERSRARVRVDTGSESFDAAFDESPQFHRTTDEAASSASFGGAPLLDYGRLVMRDWSDALRGSVAPPSALDAAVTNALETSKRLETTAVPGRCFRVSSFNPIFDFAYRGEVPVDVPSDAVWHLVPVATHSAPVDSTIIIVPRESPDAVRVATLQNPMTVPLLPGPVEVYRGDEFLIESAIDTTPVQGFLKVGLGVEPRIKVARNTRMSEESKGLISAQTVATHEVDIDIASRLSSTVTVEVRERVPVPHESQKSDIEVAVLEAKPVWETFEQPGEPILKGGKRWRFQLAAGQTQAIRYSYAIKFSAKNKLTGGNRRE
jgi:hypothetical protein